MDKIWKTRGEFNGDLVSSLLKNRNIADPDDFLNPEAPEGLFSFLDDATSSAVELILKTIKDNGTIVVHGDYDVDGVCATAILYKTITEDLSYRNCQYFIPDRFEDGYGLSEESVNKIEKLCIGASSKLLITVDCGITAVDVCSNARKRGFKVIITDHHNPPKNLPEPDALVWTDRLTGAGIAFALSLKLTGLKEEYLALASLATVADIQPVLGLNRSLVKFGLPHLKKSVGLNSLIERSGISNRELGTYELGWILTPRLNAAGRLESALDSLKLLVTDNSIEADELSARLDVLNKERQGKTFSMVEHARSSLDHSSKILLASDTSYHEGVIGLVAGKLAQEFYRPAVVLSIGDELTKGSARSVEGVSIINFLRELGDVYLGIGGHPMAAGFSIKTAFLEEFKKLLKEKAVSLDEGVLKPTILADFEISLKEVKYDWLFKLKGLEPFGLGNPEPSFISKRVRVLDSKPLKTHLKLRLFDPLLPAKIYSAIFFGGAEFQQEISSAGVIDIIYSIKENTFNGISTLDIQVRDFKI